VWEPPNPQTLEAVKINSPEISVHRTNTDSYLTYNNAQKYIKKTIAKSIKGIIMDERNQKNTLYYTKIAIRRYFGNANYRYTQLSLSSKKADKGQLMQCGSITSFFVL